MPVFFFFQAEDGIRDVAVTGVQTCALPISPLEPEQLCHRPGRAGGAGERRHPEPPMGQRPGHERGDLVFWAPRSEEHTSELQSRLHLVCRLLLEKKKKKKKKKNTSTPHREKSMSVQC